MGETAAGAGAAGGDGAGGGGAGRLSPRRDGAEGASPARPAAARDAAGPRAAPFGDLNVGHKHTSGHPEICTQDLRKSFGDHDVLKGISLQVNAGEIVVIVGSSGSGKTVFLDCVIGLMEPTAGRVLVADHDAPAGEHPAPPMVDLTTVDADTLDRIRLHWAVVFQKNALFSGSVYDNIALWLREHTSKSEEEIREVVVRSLRAVALDVDDVMGKPREALSGGMAKRVAIARAIAVDPLVIFYDEPTTGLDPVVSGQIHELIWNTHHLPHASGRRTTVIVTHDKEILRRLAPRVVMLNGGRVGFDGSYEEFSVADFPAAQHYLQAMPVLHARWTGS